MVAFQLRRNFWLFTLNVHQNLGITHDNVSKLFTISPLPKIRCVRWSVGGEACEGKCKEMISVKVSVWEKLWEGNCKNTVRILCECVKVRVRVNVSVIMIKASV